MKTLAALCLTFLCAGAANAQWWGEKTIRGNGKITTETRTVGNYDELSVAGSFEVELVLGEEGKITVEADENLMTYIETETEGDKLKIRAQEGIRLKPSRQIRLVVSFESLSKISLAGSGNIQSKNPIKTEKFTANLAGSGKIIVTVAAALVKGKIAGSGIIQLDGKADELNGDIAGSGDIAAFDLKADTVTVSIAGSGKAQVFCKEMLKTRITGSGDVIYKGAPRQEDSKVIGSGKIYKA